MPKAINIRSFLPDKEVQICQRFREARMNARMEQAEMAAALGISRVRLASYEYAKAPIRYWLARAFCRKLDVNQRWLATGKPPRTYYVDIHFYIEKSVPAKALFSKAYEDILGPFVENRIHFLADTLNIKEEEIDTPPERMNVIEDLPAGTPLEESLHVLLSRVVGIDLRLLPSDLAAPYFEKIASARSEFMEAYRSDIEKELDSKSKNQADQTRKRLQENQATLDKLKGISDNPDMQTKIRSLRSLIWHLKRTTAKHGEKSLLARHLNVSRQAVDQWLSGEAKPSADTVFQLLAWVERKEHPTK